MAKEGKKILIVDDDPQITDLLAEFCAELGLVVRAVNDSRLVLAAAQEWRPDLITLDLEMPEVDGIEILKALRADPAVGRVPVIVISVLAKESTFLRGEVQGLFSKPIDFHAVLDRVRLLLTSQAA
jgi:two-component system, OmpR family, phosphate regulon response regulator PhoB